MQLFGWGLWLPKALAEFIKQVLALSRFSVTHLRLISCEKYTYLIIHGIKHLAINNLFQLITFPLVTQCSIMDQADSLAARSRRFESSFHPCKVNLNTRRGEALHPHTHQPSPSIPRQQIRAHPPWRTMPHWPRLPSCSDRTCTHHNRNGRPCLRSREGICPLPG
jgi:hypothetical protein